jgi:nucleoside-diphosphate-sugar epimerase
MRLLLIGGSGDVGTLVIPILRQQHELRVFDLRPPADPGCEYFQGSVTDPEALDRAVEGMDVLVFMAMGHKGFDTLEAEITAFDVSVKGVYFALRAAHLTGISHAIYTSTLSVYEDLYKTYIPNEEVPTPDATHFYGFTKRLGEEVCRNAVRAWGMSVNALRLCHPVSEEQWQELAHSGQMTCHTTGSDLARALLAAVEYRNGFQAFIVTGDYQHKVSGMDKARRLLNWEPLARPNQ